MTKAQRAKIHADAAAKKASPTLCASEIPPIKQIAKQAAHEEQGRLPHGSEFHHLLWNETSGRWTGRLVVPVADGKILMFDGESGGVFKLLRKLDTMYREWLRENPTAPVDAAAPSA